MLFRSQIRFALLQVAIAVFAFFLMPHQSTFALPQDNAKLEITRPEGIDDVTWNAMVTGFEKQKADFANVLQQLHLNRIDYPRERMQTVIEKQEVISRLLNSFRERTVRELAETNMMTNYVFVRNETSPRLTGNTIRVGPQRKIKTIAAAIAMAKQGDTICVDSGSYDFFEARNFRNGLPSDIAIVGVGLSSTTIKLSRSGTLDKALRWRFSGLKIDCGDNEIVYLREGGSVEFLQCLICGYNSGAGGSNAIGGSDTIMLVQDSIFEGDSGRSSGGSGGSAFDLRGQNFLYVRNTKFESNSEILRASFPCVFDQCKAVEGAGRWGGKNQLSVYSKGAVMVRNNELADDRNSFVEFKYCVDQPEFCDLVLGKSKTLDPRSDGIVDLLKLKTHPRYWIGMLRSPDPNIQKLSVQQIESLLPIKVNLVGERESNDEVIAKLVKQLDSQKFQDREAASKELLEIGKAAKPELERVLADGSIEQKQAANKLLEFIGISREQLMDVECGRLLNWLDKNEKNLNWDKEAEAYVK